MAKITLGKSLLALAITVGLLTTSLAAEVRGKELQILQYQNEVYHVEKGSKLDFEEPKGVVLALGGGGARALVNVGVLKALEEEQIPIDLVIGTSMGAIVAVLYGSGMPIEQIEQMVTDVNLPGMFYLNVPFNRSLINTTEVNHFIEKVIPYKRLEDFPIPTALLSYDLNSGVRYLATTGNAAEAVGGPYAIPLCFPGQENEEAFLVDAGMWELTPAQAARALGAKVVIATTAYDALPYTQYTSPVRSWSRILNLIKEQNAVKIVDEYSDIVIAHEVREYSFMDFHLAKDFIDLGYRETKKQIPAIKAELAAKGINLREPALKYDVPMAKVLTDMRHERFILDPLIIKPVYYYGKDHSVLAQRIFKSPSRIPQFGIEMEYKHLSGTVLAEGFNLQNIDTAVRWKKALPAVDLEGRMGIADSLVDWEVGMNYFHGDYVLGASFAHLNEHDFAKIHNEYGFRNSPFKVHGETDLLVDLSDPTNYSQYEVVSSNEGNYHFNGQLSINPKVVLSNSSSMDTPVIYRGNGHKEFARIQAAMELVYEQQFKYSLEILQLIQITGVNYQGFIDYQNTGESIYAIGAGAVVNINLLGIKPSRFGGYLAYEPLQQNSKLGLDLDITF